MEPIGLHGGLFSGIGSGMLGLEMPLHPQPQQQQNPQNSHNPQNPQNPLHLNQHLQMVAFTQQHDTDHHHHHTQSHQSVKQQHGYLFNSKAKQQQQQQQQLSPLSDEDELGFAPDDSNGDGKSNVEREGSSKYILG